MKKIIIPAAAAAMLAALMAGPASAQIKPASSGALSYHEPEMHRHRSGFYRPNRPQHHRQHRAHSFFR